MQSSNKIELLSKTSITNSKISKNNRIKRYPYNIIIAILYLVESFLEGVFITTFSLMGDIVKKV